MTSRPKPDSILEGFHPPRYLPNNLWPLTPILQPFLLTLALSLMLFSLNTPHVQASAPSHPVKANVFKGPGLKTGCPVWERELRLSPGTGFWKRQSLRIQSRKAFGKHTGYAEAACPSIPALVAFSFNPPICLDAKPNAQVGLPGRGAWEIF